MEFERTLFRVHERFLSLEAVKKSVDYCYKGSLLIVLICLPIFLYGNFRFLGQSACLQPLVDKQFYLDPENKVNMTDPAEVNATTETGSTATARMLVDLADIGDRIVLRSDDIVQIRVADTTKKDLNLSDTSQLTAYFEFTGSALALMTDREFRKRHNFTVYNVTIDNSCYSSNFISEAILSVLNYENIMINEIIYSFKGYNRYTKNMLTGEPWSFYNHTVNSLTVRDNIITHVFNRAFGILKLLLGIFLVSNITAIYNKMTIICAPIFILAAYSLCTHPSQRILDRMNIYRAFPWIGIYLYTLNANGRKKDRYIIFAFVCMIIIFYCLYLAALMLWNFLLFSKSFPKGLDENFYGFLALIEFLVLLFVRTRTTIKYLPKMSIITMLMFLYYVQYTVYGFYNLALFIMTWVILGMVAYFLNNFEIPAVDWNPSYHYTPSIDSPRTLYIPIFSLTWYHDLPQLWTMFFPLFGRSHFSNTELAMVNRNHPLLMATLENAANGIRPGGNNEEEGGQGNNNFGFPMQQMANVEGENQDENGGNEGNNGSPVQGGAGANSNLLQNTDSDFVLDIPSNEVGNRGGNRTGSDEGSGNRYRRIDA